MQKEGFSKNMQTKERQNPDILTFMAFPLYNLVRVVFHLVHLDTVPYTPVNHDTSPHIRGYASRPLPYRVSRTGCFERHRNFESLFRLD